MVLPAIPPFILSCSCDELDAVDWPCVVWAWCTKTCRQTQNCIACIACIEWNASMLINIVVSTSVWWSDRIWYLPASLRSSLCIAALAWMKCEDLRHMLTPYLMSLSHGIRICCGMTAMSQAVNLKLLQQLVTSLLHYNVIVYKHVMWTGTSR